MPETWRLAGPMIAISGLFTFSWTGSVLVYVMTEIGRRHTKVGVQTAHHPAAPPASTTTGTAPQQPPVSH